MTTRDTLAAAALTGLLSSETMMKAIISVAREENIKVSSAVTEHAYEYADAMMRASRSDAPL